MNQESQKISQSVVKYIDILIDLYSPVPSDIRNELRTLQTALIYNKKDELNNLIASMDQKLRLKQKKKINNRSYTNLNYVSAEINKQNSQNSSNRYRLSTEESPNCGGSKNLQKFYKTNEPSALNRVGIKSENCKDLSQKKNLRPNLQKKLSSKALLKIVKKNKSQKGPFTARSQPSFSIQPFINDIKDIIEEIKKNDQELISIYGETIFKDGESLLDYGQIGIFNDRKIQEISIIE